MPILILGSVFCSVDSMLKAASRQITHGSVLFYVASACPGIRERHHLVNLQAISVIRFVSPFCTGRGNPKNVATPDKFNSEVMLTLPAEKCFVGFHTLHSGQRQPKLAN